MFDIIIIGKGLTGSAAAKYLSSSNKKVAVIGPDEAADYGKAIVFASHYDQARVQRLIGKDAVWTRLNVESAKQYDLISQQSGISFHGPAGCLYVNPYGEDTYLKQAPALAKAFGLEYTIFPGVADLSDAFINYQFPENSSGLLENGPAGFINPRLLIQAQLTIFSNNKGAIFNETVTAISNSQGVYTVKTNEGNCYRAPAILMAAGSFVNFMGLLPQQLDMIIKSEVVLLARMPDQQVKQLADLPSLLYEINHSEAEGVYLIQPVKYPDGASYIKMGCNMPEDIFFDDLSQVQEWFRYGNSDQFITRLKELLKSIMPGIKPEAYQTKRCVISRSVHGRPYIGETSQPGLYVIAGCNGYSAMCSDAIGAVASQLINKGNFPQPYSANDFKLLYKDGL
jgi:glycine/D-amino acid oxidase-like deaminating enzyme